MAAAAAAAAAAKPLKVLALCGSLRAGSCNRAMLNYAAEVAPAAGLVVTAGDVGSLPLYNSDLHATAYPAPAAALRALAREADAVLFATPEYNYSIPGTLKNAIDWLSKPDVDGTPHPLAGKPAAMMSAGGHLGGGRMQYHLRQVCVFLDMYPINKPEIMVRLYDGAKHFDDAGKLADPPVEGFIRELMANLGDWTRTLAAGRAAVAAAKAAAAPAKPLA